MLVTVITPTLNSGTYIERTLRSIWDQPEAEPGVTVEHLVIDGGSTDDTMKIVRRFPSQLWVEPDGGMYEAINKGLRKASGDVVGYLNSDDEWAREALFEIRRVFSNQPGPDWIVGPTVFVTADGTPIARLRPPRSMSAARYAALGWNCFPQPSVWFSRRLRERLGDFNAVDYRLASDYDYYLRALSLTKPTYVEEPLSRFRVHDENLSNNLSKIMGESAAIAASLQLGFFERRVLQLGAKLQVNITNPDWVRAKLTGRLNY